MINPVVLGKGIPLFKNISDRINLNLVQTRTFKSGLVLLRVPASNVIVSSNFFLEGTHSVRTGGRFLEETPAF